MTDLITRSRKEWCESVPGGRDPLTGGLVPNYRICPPSVVAALLTVLLDAYRGVDPFDGKATSGHRALAAITRALEGES